MQEYVIRGMKSQIWLCEGIYVFTCQSATGKTYLCKMLREVSRYNKAVLSLTYDNVLLDGVDVVSRLKERKYDVIMLDRFDMYQTQEICDILGELSYYTTIMVDVKDDLLYCPGIVADCFIRLNYGLLEVLPI